MNADGGTTVTGMRYVIIDQGATIAGASMDTLATDYIADHSLTKVSYTQYPKAKSRLPSTIPND